MERKDILSGRIAVLLKKTEHSKSEVIAGMSHGQGIAGLSMNEYDAKKEVC